MEAESVPLQTRKGGQKGFHVQEPHWVLLSFQPLHADYGPLCLTPVESHLKGSSLLFFPPWNCLFYHSTKLTWQQLDFPGSSAHSHPGRHLILFLPSLSIMLSEVSLSP